MDKNINKTIQEIKDLKIQGATSIVKEAVRALGKWSSENSWKYRELVKLADKLSFARPTEPLSQNCIFWLLQKAKLKEGQSLLAETGEIIELLDKTKDESIEKGVQVIKNNSTILTHCHSSAVTSILKRAHKKGMKIKVFLTETRPKYQGRITAKELIKARIEATMITDSEASFIISREEDIKIDLVIVGADAINIDGSAINKVGSYGLSLSANKAKVPFYVTSVLLKYSPFPIIIEERSEDEVWRDRPKNLEILNLAFDKIPAEFITSFITEKGLIRPEDIKDEVCKYYPWIFSKRLNQ